MTAATVMSPLAPGAAAIRTRDAVPGDNAALVALSSACAMTGDVGLCVDRAPDFFALNRLEGDRWRVGVATVGKEAAEDVAGCIAVAERMAYVRGAPMRVGWVSDFKVHPRHRGGPVADALTRWASATGRALLGRDDAPLTMTILAGNVPMERRAAGQRGLPVLAPFADLDAWAVPLLWRRRTLVDGVRVARASERDVEEMAALWARVAPGRQFAPVLDAPSLAAWVSAAPGLALSDYLIARGRDGRIAGFLALWDQSSFKQLRVTSYSRRLAAVRAALNAVGPLAGAAPLPPAGEPLRTVSALHVCVPGDAAAVLRALLLAAHDALRGRDYAFFTVGLDARDPLRVALRGLWAQPTVVRAYVTTPAGCYAGPRLDALPLHHEVALT